MSCLWRAQCDSNWCRAYRAPANYKFKNLPGGKPLADKNLRAAIKSAIKPFQTEEWCEKLADCGSSQANKCVNSMAVTKAPKIRHYRSSENSNVQKAHSSCQFNEGYKYLNQTKKTTWTTRVRTHYNVCQNRIKKTKESARKEECI